MAHIYHKQDFRLPTVLILATILALLSMQSPKVNAQQCQAWDFYNDFKLNPNQSNPMSDNCGNPNVWHLLQSASLTRDPNTYTNLPTFWPDTNGFQGVEAWMGSEYQGAYNKLDLPIIGVNTTNTLNILEGGSWNPYNAHAHPWSTRMAIIGWKSPISGHIQITGSAFVTNQCGDGILWFIDRGIINLASGYAGNQNFADGNGGSALTNVQVTTGDFVYLVVHPNADYTCDTTQFSFHIQALDVTSSPIEAIQQIIATVNLDNLPQGLTNSLVAKLQSAQQALSNGGSGNNTAINKLQAFINEVQAQRDKKISGAAADILIGMAQQVINTLSGT